MNTHYLFLITTFFLMCNAIHGASVGDMSVLEYGPGYNTYGHQQMKTALNRGITPVVDGIKEEEKYGNDGGYIRTASNTFIRITEGASGALTKTLGKPNENTYNVLQIFSPVLTDLGNRLGGLAK